jgi:hypothetical protein
MDLTSTDTNVIGVWSEGIKITTNGHNTRNGPVRGVGDSDSKKRAHATASISGKKDKGKGKSKEDDGPKQGSIWREWALPDNGKLRIIEQTSFDLDKVGHDLAVIHCTPNVDTESLGLRTRIIVLVMAIYGDTSVFRRQCWTG